MPAELELYSFEDADGHEHGTFTTFDVVEARNYARQYRLKLVANTYERVDSEMIEDYTESEDYISDEELLAEVDEEDDDDVDTPLYREEL